MKNKDVDIDFRKIGSSIGGFFERFHTIIFFVIIGVSLFVCIAVILSILNLSGKTDAATAQPVNQSFDEQTIQKLNNLDNADSSNSLQTSGRSNPFVE